MSGSLVFWRVVLHEPLSLARQRYLGILGGRLGARMFIETWQYRNPDRVEEQLRVECPAENEDAVREFVARNIRRPLRSEARARLAAAAAAPRRERA